MSVVMTFRVSDELASDIDVLAKAQSRSRSDVGSRALEEWLRMEQFPGIEFRTAAGLRIACLKLRMPVHEVIRITKSYTFDVHRTAEHCALTPELVQAAIQYYERFRTEIDMLIPEGDAALAVLQRFFPDVCDTILPSR